MQNILIMNKILNIKFVYKDIKRYKRKEILNYDQPG